MWQYDVLPLETARRDAVANKVFLGPGAPATLISMVLFTFSMRRQLIRLASASFSPPVWQSLVSFRLPCATPGNEAERKIYGGWVKSLALF